MDACEGWCDLRHELLRFGRESQLVWLYKVLVVHSCVPGTCWGLGIRPGGTRRGDGKILLASAPF